VAAPLVVAPEVLPDIAMSEVIEAPVVAPEVLPEVAMSEIAAALVVAPEGAAALIVAPEGLPEVAMSEDTPALVVAHAVAPKVAAAHAVVPEVLPEVALLEVAAAHVVAPEVLPDVRHRKSLNLNAGAKEFIPFWSLGPLEIDAPVPTPETVSSQPGSDFASGIPPVRGTCQDSRRQQGPHQRSAARKDKGTSKDQQAKLQRLKELFPQVSRDVISQALQRNNYDEDAVAGDDAPRYLRRPIP
jgi:hypothetical protein